MEKNSKVLAILFGLFTSTVVMTNAVSGHLISLGPFVFVAGTLLYPFTFLLTDILSEVYGKKVAQTAVWTGFAAQMIAVFSISVIALLPSVDQETGQAFRKIFSPVMRIVVASMCAYLVSQSIDVRLFHFIRKKTKGRHLWLRNNLATMASQGIDTFIFIAIAFAGELESKILLSMFCGQYLAKVILAAIDTPLCYAGVYLTKKAGGIK